MPTFIEVLLTTGEKRHVEAAAGNARTEIDRWATRAKTSWIETVEGIWVNPDFVVSARLVDLPTRPAAIRNLTPRPVGRHRPREMRPSRVLGTRRLLR